jgi:beta-lactamase regulating signal transducer with metallopeptidase domain
MLVLAKLVLPPSLWSPVSVGTWFGDQLKAPATALLESPGPALPDSHPAEFSPVVTNILSRPEPPVVEPHVPAPVISSATPEPTFRETTPVGRPHVSSLDWQGLMLLIWIAVTIALLLLLAQRTFFVRGLVAQAEEAGGALLSELDQCRQRLGLCRPVSLRLSPHAASPAVCGLWRPVILVPQTLAARLHGADLRAVLYHELAHVKRGDLWINLVQTLLQILYFYNPLLWLANAVIRRIREKAVDEAVLVALGEAAPQYPDTLIHVARLALAQRPALSLRLIGVVESKHALSGRIKHILDRPFPQTTRLGLLGVLVVGVAALVLLPMTKGGPLTGWLHPDRLLHLASREDAAGTYRGDGVGDEYSKEYQVTFRPDEKLLVVAELYQTDRPMQTLAYRVFSAPAQPEKLPVRLRRQYADAGKTTARYDVSVTLGRQSLRIEPSPSAGLPVYPDTHCGFFTGTELKSAGAQPYHEMENLLLFTSGKSGDPRNLPRGRIWIPGYNNVTWIFKDVYFIMVKMLPLSQLDHLQVGAPDMAEPEQLPDGTILPPDASKEQRQAVADEYVLNLKRLLLHDRMPLKKLRAHRYYRTGEPVWVNVQGMASSPWKLNPQEIHRNPGGWPYLLLIDGKEYECGLGFDPFDGGGGSLDILDNIYIKPGESPLSLGKHTVAYG